MESSIALVLALVLLASGEPQFTEQACESVITVNSTSLGSNCDDVDQCENLTRAFEQAKACDIPVIIQLGPGCYQLGSAEVGTFVNKTEGFTLRGSAMNRSVVCCAPFSGISFHHSNNISLQHVIFHGCGALHYSTSKNFTGSSSGMSYVKFQVGLYFLSCSNLNLSSVIVRRSNGTGMVLYNTDGENVFEKVAFDNNLVQNGTYPGGGGLVIEFSYCEPGDVSCTIEISNSKSSYSFHKCHFQNNVASDDGAQHYPTYPHGREHNAFGLGGGVSIHFKGNAVDNVIKFKHCYFRGNKAKWGGGISLRFEDNSQHNKVVIENSVIQLNGWICQDLASDRSMSGGGVKIDFIHYPPDSSLWQGYEANVKGNRVTFTRTYITVNQACYGGGVSFTSSRAPPGTSPTNSLSFESCFFRQNMARIAAAVDLSVWLPDTANGSLMEPAFINCTFVDNSADFYNLSGYEAGMGAVYVNGVPTFFHGDTRFTENSGTALVVANTGIHVTNYSTMTFSQNRARRGGALAFIGNAWMVAYHHTNFLFQKNTATQKGGAIYATHFGEHDVLYRESCFVRYYKYTEHPNQWTAFFNFSENAASIHQGDSIYINSLYPCTWPIGDSPVTTIDHVFCWKNWNFDEDTNCTTQVSTATAKFNETYPYFFNTSAYPGQRFLLPIKGFNDYHKRLKQTVFTAWSKDSSVAEVDPDFQYIADGSMVVFGVPNETATIGLETLDPRVVSTQLKVKIQPCPPGFVPKTRTNDSNITMATACKCGSKVLLSSCDEEKFEAKLRRGYCMTYLQGTSDDMENAKTHVVIGKCPYAGYEYLVLPNSTSQLQDKVCGNENRGNTLCGKCRKNYGVAVNSYSFKCIECSHHSNNWLIYIATEFLPITVFLIIVATFRISATSAPMNAFVFFSQIISLPYFQIRFPWVYGVTMQSDALQHAFLSLYGIWNLDFFKSIEHRFCLSPHLSTLHILALGYVTAFYPMILIIACYICIELHARNFRPLVCVWRPFQHCLYRFRRNWEPRTSIIDAFATFLLLAYAKLTFVSFSLLTPTYFLNVTGHHVGPPVFYFDATMEYFEGEHLGLALVAIVILVIFVVVPPLFLIIYPFKTFQKCLNLCPLRCHVLHTFADSFQGCFKDGTRGSYDYRYFAGLYFVFRIIIFIVYVVEEQTMTQYLIQQVLCTLAMVLFATLQPYKEPFYNVLDLGFFTLLAILNSLSFYNSYHVLAHSSLSTPVFAINYALLYLPIVYITMYVIYWFLISRNRLGRCLAKLVPKAHAPATTEVSSMTGENSELNFDTYDDEELPDRLLNPQNYRPINPPLQPMHRACSKEWFSESSYLQSRPSGARRYGSTENRDRPFSAPEQHRSNHGSGSHQKPKQVVE